ncbi:hypothetical protein [Sphingomonas sp. Leaf22]|uniref:hypothetical protein n=1 Tax=Sphingomonas sp. Leaf22 TaxID=1735687 RepID=UPI000AEDA8B5|nr:hypothetical protein [Sphingomonas sp. Leaf22]
MLNLLATAALAGAASLSLIQMGFVDVGEKPTDSLAATKQLMAGRLRDPQSAQYQVGELKPARCKGGLLSGNVAWEGWAANVAINGKNAYGAYTGYQPYTVLFSGDRAVNVVEGLDFGVYGPAKGLLGLGGGAGVCKYLRQ